MRCVLCLLLLAGAPAPAHAQDPAAADRAWREGRPEVARPIYEAILAADSTDDTALHRLALIHAWAGDFAASLRLLDRLLALQPERDDVRIDRARVLAWAGRFDEARAVYERLLAADPANASARRGLARLAAWRGDLVDAERRWRALLAADPDDAEALAGLSQTLRWQGRPAPALVAARRAVALSPGAAEVRDELREVERLTSPQAAPTAAWESDSDGNRMSTFATRARLRPLPRLELRADAYARDADQVEGARLEHRAHGATVTARLEVRPGWSLAGGAGGSASDVSGDVVASGLLAVATPRRLPVSGTLRWSRGAFDATALLVEHRVRSEELALDGFARLGAATTLAGTVSGGRFVSARSGRANPRTAASLSLTRRWSPALEVGVAGRTFGFEKDLDDGYFDPDVFALGEVVGRWTRARGALSFMLEGAPGLQRVGSGGDTDAVFRGTARLTRALGIGRELTVGGVLASSGGERLSPGDGGDYSYRALTASLIWTF